MKICLLFGSPHADGATARLVKEYLSRFPDAEVTRFDFYKTPVSPCTGCGGCKETGTCVFRDMDEVYRALEESDRLLIATPVYCLSAPAPLKAALDRLQPYFERRFSLHRTPIQKRRTASLLLSYGSDKYGGTAHLIETVRMLCTVLNANLEDIIVKKDNADGRQKRRPII